VLGQLSEARNAQTHLPQTLKAICRLPLRQRARLWNLVESLTVTERTEPSGDRPLRSAAGMLEAAPLALPKCEDGNLRETLQKIEAQILRETLQRYGTQSKVARHLGVAQATIARKTKRYGLGA
jgi:transcriptional regulator with PAS, ATPase and Fis domain